MAEKSSGEEGMKNLFKSCLWWRILYLGLGLTLFSGYMQSTPIITTATGGTAANGYQATTPTFTSEDVMRGFIMFKGGFTLPSDGNVIYDADGPVYGPLTFGTGTSTLKLYSDLRLGTTGWFANGGGMFPSRTLDGCPASGGPGNSILMGGDQTLNFSLEITTSICIDGCGNTLTLGSSGSLTLQNRATLTLKNMNLIVNASLPFSSSNGAAYLGLENVNVFLQQDSCIFGANCALMPRIQGFVGIYGPYAAKSVSFAYGNPSANKCTIAINSGSTLYVGPGATLDLSYIQAPAANKIGMQDSSSVLWLDGCTLKWLPDNANGAMPLRGQGLVLKKGTILIGDKTTILDLDSSGNANTDITQGLIFGDGTAANDVDVRVLGGAYTVLKGCMQYYHS
jgi:hypothetical protein